MMTRRKLFGLLAGLPFVRVAPAPMKAIVVKGRLLDYREMEAAIANAIIRSIDQGFKRT